MIIENKTNTKLYLQNVSVNSIIVGDRSSLSRQLASANYTFTNGNRFVQNDYLLQIPSWISNGDVVVIKDIDNDIAYSRRVSFINNGVGTSGNVFFEVDLALPTTMSSNYTIHNDYYSNTNGVIQHDLFGNSLTGGVVGVNMGDLSVCSEIVTDDTYGLLIYDKKEDSVVGSVNVVVSENPKRVRGVNTEFVEAFKVGDNILIDNEYDIVDTIRSNSELIVRSGFALNHIGATCLKISDPDDDIESIVYSTYDDRDDLSEGNHKSTFSLRSGRSIYYKFGAKEHTSNFVNTNEFAIPYDKTVDVIYKIWVNGVLLKKNEYAVDLLNNKIVVVNSNIVRKFNNYSSIITYNRTKQNGISGQYATLAYEGYDTTFQYQAELFDSLYDFMYYDGFSESNSYNFYEYRNRILDSINRKIKGKDNTLSFNSVVSSEDSDVSVKVITKSLTTKVKNRFKFRMIKYNTDSGTIGIYNDCQYISPGSESVDIGNSTINYSIFYRDKMVFASRAFGSGDWGRFSLFGLELISYI